MATINPTFLLKGLDVKKLIDDYLSETFSRIYTPQRTIPALQASLTLDPVRHRDPSSPQFLVLDKNQQPVVATTTGYQRCQYFRTNGTLPATGGECDYCRLTFKGTALGYPVDSGEYTLQEHDKHHIIYVFWLEGTFCTYECVLAWLQMEYRNSQYDTDLQDSIGKLYTMYYLSYGPDKLLHAANDYRLLQRNGGALREDQWRSTTHRYVKSPRVLCLPVQTVYLQEALH